MNRKITIAVVLAAMACTATVWAQDGSSLSTPGGGGPGGRNWRGGRGGMGMGMMMSPVMATATPKVSIIESNLDSFKLSDDNSTKLLAITKANDKTVAELSQKSAGACKELQAALTASTYDSKNVKALAAKAQKAEADIVAANLNTWAQIRAILTSEQVSQLKKAMSSRRGPGGPGFGERPQGQPGNPPSEDNQSGDRPTPPPSDEGSGSTPPEMPQE